MLLKLPWLFCCLVYDSLIFNCTHLHIELDGMQALRMHIFNVAHRVVLYLGMKKEVENHRYDM